MKWIARAMATTCRWPPDSDLTGDLKFLKFGFRRPMTLRVADSIAGVVERADARRELAAEEQVAGGVDVVGERQRLVDRLDAVAPWRRAGCGSRPVCPSIRISPESAGCAPESDPHQRRLAGAVAADEADDLARLEVDGDVVDGVDAAERDADVAHLDERRARGATVTVRWRCRGCGHEPRLAGRARRRSRRRRTVSADGRDEDDPDDDVLAGRVDADAGPCPTERLHDDARRGPRPGSSRCRRRTTSRR